MTALAAISPVRKAVLRSDKVINYTRKTNVEAEMAQLVGEAQDPECDHCEDGSGPWDTCVKVADSLGLNSSCANCHYGSMGTRCSLRTYTGP